MENSVKIKKTAALPILVVLLLTGCNGRETPASALTGTWYWYVSGRYAKIDIKEAAPSSDESTESAGKREQMPDPDLTLSFKFPDESRYTPFMRGHVSTDRNSLTITVSEVNTDTINYPGVGGWMDRSQAKAILLSTLEKTGRDPDSPYKPDEPDYSYRDWVNDWIEETFQTIHGSYSDTGEYPVLGSEPLYPTEKAARAAADTE